MGVLKWGLATRQALSRQDAVNQLTSRGWHRQA